jgi:hypothetical protein
VHDGLFVDLKYMAPLFPIPGQQRALESAGALPLRQRSRVYFKEMVEAKETTLAEEEEHLKSLKRN